jgi:hypothetical protein
LLCEEGFTALLNMTHRLILESVAFNSGQTKNDKNRRIFIDKTTKNDTTFCGQSSGSKAKSNKTSKAREVIRNTLKERGLQSCGQS